MSDSITIAIDAMGSDKGPEEIISGAALSKERHPNSNYIFFGDYRLINKVLNRFVILQNSSEIIDSNFTVSPDDKP